MPVLIFGGAGSHLLRTAGVQVLFPWKERAFAEGGVFAEREGLRRRLSGTLPLIGLMLYMTTRFHTHPHQLCSTLSPTSQGIFGSLNWNSKCTPLLCDAGPVTILGACPFSAHRFLNTITIVHHSHGTDEVNMAFIRLSSVKATADVVSSILNWICPECGGRMGGLGKEYKCQGKCQTDWRLTWERYRSVRH